MTTPPLASLNDLHTFATVARTRNFRRAAAELGVSPSALSHALRGLEARLGVRLLNRTTRSVAPTEAGQRLLDRLTPALLEVQGALDAVNAFRDSPLGTLRINAPRAVELLKAVTNRPEGFIRHDRAFLHLRVLMRSLEAQEAALTTESRDKIAEAQAQSLEDSQRSADAAEKKRQARELEVQTLALSIAAGAAELRGDDQATLAADLHSQHALVPALDDLAHADDEAERLAAVERAVELLAVLEHAGLDALELLEHESIIQGQRRKREHAGRL